LYGSVIQVEGHLSASNSFISIELPIRIKSSTLVFNRDGNNKNYKDLFPVIELNCPLAIHLSSNKKSNITYPNFVNEESLKFLAEQITLARNDLTELEVYRNKIEKKVNMQSEEYFNQLKKLKSINERVTNIISINSNKLTSRIERIINNQAVLIKKADILLQILFDHCQPELTEEERKWFNELKHLSSIITKKHKPHIIQLRQQLDMLKEETKDKIELTEQAIILGTSQKKSVFEALKQESIALMNTMNTLNNLQNEMENLKISN